MNYEKGIVSSGNYHRLLHYMELAEQGAPLTIGFIGGSITQGSLASTEKNCYAYRVFSWWQNKFQKSDMTYVNAGIGGTTSHFGVARVEIDLLQKKPDVVFVEFSVNDEDNDFFLETYEGLIRRIYKEESNPAIVLIHNVCYDTGKSAEKQHLMIGKHYQLPCISMKSTIYEAVLSGEIKREDITPDNLHPNDKGHELVATVITHYLEDVAYELQRTNETSIIGTHPMCLPLTKNAYETSKRYQNQNSKPSLEGFIADDETQDGITDCFKNGWTARHKGDKISFQVYGSEIAIQYRKSVEHTVPIAKVTIDDLKEDTKLLDGNFEEDWGDCLYLTTVMIHGEEKEHSIVVEIVEEGDETKAPFYLVSVIVSGKYDRIEETET